MSDSLATFLTVATGLLALAESWLAMRMRGWRWLSRAASTAGVACALAVGAFVVMNGERPARLPSITGDLLFTLPPRHHGPGLQPDDQGQYVANTDVWDAVAERQLIDRKLVTPNKATPPKPPPVTVPTPPDDNGEPIVTAPPPTVAPPVAWPQRGRRPPSPARASVWLDPAALGPAPPGVPLDQVATPPPKPSPSLAERLARQGVTDDQVHRAVDLVELAKRQISQLSIFVAWRDELPWGRQTPIKAVHRLGRPGESRGQPRRHLGQDPDRGDDRRRRPRGAGQGCTARTSRSPGPSRPSAASPACRTSPSNGWSSPPVPAGPP